MLVLINKFFTVIHRLKNRLVIFLLIVALPSYTSAYTTFNAFFAGSYDGARSSCLAFANPLGGGCGGGNVWAGQTNFAAGSLCANGNSAFPWPQNVNCGLPPDEEPEYLFNYYYYPVYELGTAYDKNKNSCTVGNPIDPVTGVKKQKEPLINLNAAQPLVLDLFYNSSSMNKWTHSYSRRLIFSDTPTGNRFDLYNYGSANGFNPVAQPEQSSFLGGVVSDFGKKNTAPVNTGQIYLTKEEACTSGWGAYKNKLNYSWLHSSVAEYLPNAYLIIWSNRTMLYIRCLWWQCKNGTGYL